MSHTVVQVSPLGTSFEPNRISLAPEIGGFTNVQDVVAADFDGDGYQDTAVALFDANEIAIRLNQGDGTIAEDPIVLSLVPPGEVRGAGPIALVAANLNPTPPGEPVKFDLIVANNLNSTATVLMDLVDGADHLHRRARRLDETPPERGAGSAAGRSSPASPYGSLSSLMLPVSSTGAK